MTEGKPSPYANAPTSRPSSIAHPADRDRDDGSEQAKQQSVSISSLDAEEIAAFGSRWLAAHKAQVSAMPTGTGLAVDMSSGKYVSASNCLSAMDLFEETFGLQAIAWVHEVGVPISLGGGLWQLRSDT